MCTFVLTSVFCIEKALKGTEIVYSLSGIRITSVLCIEKALKGTEIVYSLSGIRITSVRTKDVLLYVRLGELNLVLLN